MYIQYDLKVRTYSFWMIMLLGYKWFYFCRQIFSIRQELFLSEIVTLAICHKFQFTFCIERVYPKFLMKQEKIKFFCQVEIDFLFLFTCYFHCNRSKKIIDHTPQRVKRPPPPQPPPAATSRRTWVYDIYYTPSLYTYHKKVRSFLLR
jgi:hypothetical protein